MRILANQNKSDQNMIEFENYHTETEQEMMNCLYFDFVNMLLEFDYNYQILEVFLNLTKLKKNCLELQLK